MAATMARVTFRTDELPPQLDDQARFDSWRDLVEKSCGGEFDVARTPDRPFSMRSDLLRFGKTVLGQLNGAITKAGWPRDVLSVVGNDNYCLNMNFGRSRVKLFHPAREVVLEGGTATLFTMSGRAELNAGPDGGLSYGALMVPRGPLRELVANAEDHFGKVLHPRLPALRHLKRYLDIINEPDLAGDEPALAEHIETTILDLVALTLGAGRDASRIAGMRGLRAARAQEIIAEIRTRFADPAFSPRDVEMRLGLSPRYVQELLQETGSSLSERVLELRLQKARNMLASPRYDRLKVVEIACAAGFNEVSYFNRCFRRRFGDSPMAFRDRKAIG